MNKQKAVVIITVCFGLGILGWLYQNKTKSISTNGIKTIAMVTGFDGGHATSGPAILYTYSVGDKKYRGSKYVDDVSIYKSRFYAVLYSSSTPKWSEILLKEPITDTIAIKAAGLTLPKKKTNQFQER